MIRAKHTPHVFIWVIGAILSLISCSTANTNENTNDSLDTANATDAPKPQDAVRPAEVTTMLLQEGDFNHEIISNGTLAAAEAVDLNFRSNEVIDEIYVQNGQHVARGQKLAQTDKTRLLNNLVQQRTALEQARLSLRDILIGQGYDPDDTIGIPAEVMMLARTKSGIESAQAALKSTQLDLTASTLTAPIAGVVANLKSKRHNMASSTEPFCRIIGDAAMDVEFPILEGELALVKPGNKIAISTYTNAAQISGTVTAVNPMVDKNGMVSVWARADKHSSAFIDGMNVRVRIRRSLPNQLVVPKTAVVLRSDRQVVFTYDGNGRAAWNYVTTGLENLDQCTIVEGLKPGMEVITTGNINLAHESPVTVIETGH